MSARTASGAVVGSGASGPRWRPPLHPLLLALYLVLGLVAENLGEARLAAALRSLLVLPLLAAALMLVLRPLCRSLDRAALVSSLCLVVAFTHGAVSAVAERWLSAWLGGALFWLVVAAELVVVGVAARIIVSWRRLGRGPTQLLDLVAAVLLALALGEILLFAQRQGWPLLDRTSAAREVDAGLSLAPPPEQLPDIYYIVLDAYTRSDTLRAFYDGDNSALLDFLRERGFRVASRSFTNYLSTRLVFPSVLNFEYLDELADRVGRQSRDVAPLREATERSRIALALRGIGYRIVNINSGLDYVALAEPDEDIRLETSWLQPNEFESALAAMTPLPDLLERSFGRSGGSPAALHRRRVEYAIDRLAEQGGKPGPKLVVAHIFAPHDPLVFGPRGEARAIGVRLFYDYSADQQRRIMAAYRDQVAYLDTLMIRALRRLLDESLRAPIVILQGDHGLRLFLERAASGTCLRESFAILNAVLLPGSIGTAVEVPDTLSPVNGFRLVLDAYFGAQLGLLDDRAFFSHRFGLYDFQEVTAEVESCTTMGRIPAPY